MGGAEVHIPQRIPHPPLIPAHCRDLKVLLMYWQLTCQTTGALLVLQCSMPGDCRSWP